MGNLASYVVGTAMITAGTLVTLSGLRDQEIDAAKPLVREYTSFEQKPRLSHEEILRVRELRNELDVKKYLNNYSGLKSVTGTFGLVLPGLTCLCLPNRRKN